MKKRKGNTKARFYEVDEDGELTFKPSTRMQLFAAYWFCHPQYKSFSSDELCKELGYQKGTFEAWCHKYDPDFTEWIEEQRAMFRGRENAKKAMLEFVGMQKAVEGEFNFWKPMAIREKVIDPDQLNHNIKPISLEQFNDFTQEQVDKHANSLLESLCSLEGQEEPIVVESNIGGEQGSDQGGTPEMQELPMALPESMGQDRERTLDDDIPL